MEMETEAKKDRAHTVIEIEKSGPTGKYLRMLNGDIQKIKGVL